VGTMHRARQIKWVTVDNHPLSSLCNFLFFNLCYNINIKYKIDFKIYYLDTTNKEWLMRKDTKNFIKSAEYDLKTAEFMLNSER